MEPTQPTTWTKMLPYLIKVFRHVIFNGLLAILPVFFNLGMTKLSTDAGIKSTPWSGIVRDGSLLVYSSTMSAISMDTLFFRPNHYNDGWKLLFSVIFTLIVIASGGVFGADCFQKWHNQNNIDPNTFACISNVCGGLTFVVSLMVILGEKTS